LRARGGKGGRGEKESHGRKRGGEGGKYACLIFSLTPWERMGGGGEGKGKGGDRKPHALPCFYVAVARKKKRKRGL